MGDQVIYPVQVSKHSYRHTDDLRGSDVDNGIDYRAIGVIAPRKRQS